MKIRDIITPLYPFYSASYPNNAGSYRNTVATYVPKNFLRETRENSIWSASPNQTSQLQKSSGPIFNFFTPLTQYSISVPLPSYATWPIRWPPFPSRNLNVSRALQHHPSPVRSTHPASECAIASAVGMRSTCPPSMVATLDLRLIAVFRLLLLCKRYKW